MTDIFSVQDLISERVAAALAVTLAGGERERLTKHHTENAEAYHMDLNSGFAHWSLRNAYVQKGMYEKAIAEHKKAIPLSGDSPDELASLGYAYALSGRRCEAQAVIDELQERSKGAISRRPSSRSSTRVLGRMTGPSRG